ncbi:MAG: type I restriction endonuclease subunit R [Bacteroidetes bacterium]|nr:type I restriction endonuclease subunit R [Bacteroidota bacterium]HET6245887.1 HsdR family type I site-specific deoxyribonuclease [Bacteroidia bacterium]
MTNYQENNDSQLPALLLLQKLGWKYISPQETDSQRGNIKSNVILEGILEERLKELNSFEYKGNKHKFSDGNIHASIHALKNLQDDGLVRTNERAYDLISLGKSFEETIQGDKKSFTIKYIDWENIHNNVFHITDEYVVDGLTDTRRPDIVLFVNGIPFVVIENKRRDKNSSIEESISQHTRNQGKEQGVPKLFYYNQLLLAVQPNEVKYGAIDTKPKFWSFWQEQQDVEHIVKKIINSNANGIKAEDRLPTEQDKVLYSLCSPDRLMELVFKFTLYDGGVKKIARYQQYTAVKNSLDRIKEFNNDGQRKGGVIWHTQGSGKSLTMVMLAKSIALEKEIINPRIIIVTDRIDLDKQISSTFNACGKEALRAKSGNHLIELINESGVEIITTVIDKFESALNRKDFNNQSSNIFVLVDESHRSQYGSTHAKMKRVLPKACYIGFTGTPLLKKDKSTADKFGGFIDKYTINQAVKDKAVVPLLYEGRSAKLTVNQGQIDKGFDRLAEPLTMYQTKDLKRKFSSLTEIYKSGQVVEEIAFDISQHFCKNVKGTKFKAMLAVPLKATAMKYQKYFEEQTNPALKINTAVIISAPDTREDHEEVDEEPNDEVQKFWKRIVTRNGTPEAYEESTISKFKSNDDDVELLIVVSKLLTGFDSPNCSFLYIAKPLAEHNLLQAIARVNRLHEGKDFGFIIDYVGILGQLDSALTQYSALQEFDEHDLIGTVVNVLEEIKKLPQRNSELWDVFKEVANKKDIEAMERFLAPKDRRDLFIEKLTAFAKNLQVALSSDEFYKLFSDKQIHQYLSELKFFQSLRASVSVRYAEKIHYKEYEARVRKLLDTYIGAEGVEQITESINIFDEEIFKQEVQRVTGSVASKADAIAYKMKKVISEKMDEDPVFYKKFSQLIDETIKAFQDRRLTEGQYLETILKNRDNLINGSNDGIPTVLNGKPEARAFYGIIAESILPASTEPVPSSVTESLAKMGVEITEIIQRLTIRDWKRNDDVQKQMKNDLEDYLLAKRKELGVEISFSQIDAILDEVLKVAKHKF